MKASAPKSRPTLLRQDANTYYIWIGGSCDYGHKERAGGAAVIIEHGGHEFHRESIGSLHTTEFRMMLTLMARIMNQLPPSSTLLFITNAAYLQNFDRPPTPRSANPDLINQCIDEKARHNSVAIRIVPYHRNPLLIATHDMATEAMAQERRKAARQEG